jgi:hypothetical protein
LGKKDFEIKGAIWREKQIYHQSKKRRKLSHLCAFVLNVPPRLSVRKKVDFASKHWEKVNV